MSRYIDKDSAIDLSISVLCGGGNEEMAVLVEDINSAPTIEIIRCGECKHRKPSGYVGFVKTYECDITGLRMHDLTNHFCSYGEREGER